MGVVVIKNILIAKDVAKAREDYEFYIKVTADIENGIVAIGGEYHADAEKILIEEEKSRSKNIWGGGYNIQTKNFETNAIINLRPGINDSMEIVDPEVRKRYIELVENKLKKIQETIVHKRKN